MSKEKDSKQLNIELLEAAKNGRTKEVLKLLEEGAEIEYTSEEDSTGNTALILATINGHIETVKALLRKGADVDHANKSKKVPIMLTDAAIKLYNNSKSKNPFKRKNQDIKNIEKIHKVLANYIKEMEESTQEIEKMLNKKIEGISSAEEASLIFLVPPEQLLGSSKIIDDEIKNFTMKQFGKFISNESLVYQAQEIIAEYLGPKYFTHELSPSIRKKNRSFLHPLGEETNFDKLVEKFSPRNIGTLSPTRKLEFDSSKTDQTSSSPFLSKIGSRKVSPEIDPSVTTITTELTSKEVDKRTSETSRSSPIISIIPPSIGSSNQVKIPEDSHLTFLEKLSNTGSSSIPEDYRTSFSTHHDDSLPDDSDSDSSNYDIDEIDFYNGKKQEYKPLTSSKVNNVYMKEGNKIKESVENADPIVDIPPSTSPKSAQGHNFSSGSLLRIT